MSEGNRNGENCNKDMHSCVYHILCTYIQTYTCLCRYLRKSRYFVLCFAKDIINIFIPVSEMATNWPYLRFTEETKFC